MIRATTASGRRGGSRCLKAAGSTTSRGLKRCFGLDTAAVTSIADNPVGRLLQDLIYRGGVDQSLVRWVDCDGVARGVHNGLNFTESGFGVRPASGCSDRGHTAVSQLKPGDIDWDEIFGKHGARWFHTGGIFCAPFGEHSERGHSKRRKLPASTERLSPTT